VIFFFLWTGIVPSLWEFVWNASRNGICLYYYLVYPSLGRLYFTHNSGWHQKSIFIKKSCFIRRSYYDDNKKVTFFEFEQKDFDTLRDLLVELFEEEEQETTTAIVAITPTMPSTTTTSTPSPMVSSELLRIMNKPT
jgi:hypothetical protein